MATTRQIEIFIQLANQLHFGRAAQILNISQAALSKELSSLEQSLNVRLVDRSNKWNIVLTAAGKAYFQQIKNLPHILERAEKSARRANRGETGTINIAVANLIYDYLQLGDFFRLVHEKYPELKLIIRDFQGSPVICNQIVAGEADIGFLGLSSQGSPELELRQYKLLELDISFAIPRKHPLAVKKNLELKDFAGCNFILPPAQFIPWLRLQFEKKFREACNAPLKVEQEAVGIRATRQLVSAGLGIGLVTEPFALDERENIVYRKVSQLDLKRIVVAVWDESNQSPILKNVLSLLPEFARNLGKK